MRLRGALIGIDDEDDSTFTITVDNKTFHFQVSFPCSAYFVNMNNHLIFLKFFIVLNIFGSILAKQASSATDRHYTWAELLRNISYNSYLRVGNFGFSRLLMLRLRVLPMIVIR